MKNRLLIFYRFAVKSLLKKAGDEGNFKGF